MNQNRLYARLIFLLAVILLMGVIPAHADAPPEPRDVQIEAARRCC